MSAVSDDALYFADSYSAVCIDILVLVIVAAVTGFNMKNVRLIGFILALSSFLGDAIFFGASLNVPTTSAGCNAANYFAMIFYSVSLTCQNLILYSRIFVLRSILRKEVRFVSALMFSATLISNWVRLLGVQVNFTPADDQGNLAMCNGEFDPASSEVAFWISVVNEITISILVMYCFYLQFIKTNINAATGTSSNFAMHVKVLIKYSGLKTLIICIMYLIVAALNQTLDPTLVSSSFITDQLNSFISAFICFDSLSRDLINEGVEHKQSHLRSALDKSKDAISLDQKSTATLKHNSEASKSASKLGQ